MGRGRDWQCRASAEKSGVGGRREREGDRLGGDKTGGKGKDCYLAQRGDMGSAKWDQPSVLCLPSRGGRGVGGYGAGAEGTPVLSWAGQGGAGTEGDQGPLPVTTRAVGTL